MTREQKKKEVKPNDLLGDNLKDAGIKSTASIKYTDNLDKHHMKPEQKPKPTEKKDTSNKT